MTWIYDVDKPRIWVEIPLPKKRKSPRALRFAGLQLGDQLMKLWTSKGLGQSRWYYLVSDMWFDPVAGQDNRVAGEMVAIMSIDDQGMPSHKEAHTLRGLASQGFEYADRDFIAFCRDRIDAIKTGAVVGIGAGSVIRNRPKFPGL